MPECGSQITICDLPIRFDTYKGCSHACRYCFVQRKTTLNDIKIGETVESLKKFIDGKRTKNTNWCDWNIPLHWGGMSDPFQPIEKNIRNSYECLKIFAKTQYPFIVSTKGKLIATDEYLELIKKCNCVVQISAVCSEYDKIELGCPTFDERLEMIRKISKYKRVIVRIQPYMVEVHKNVLESINKIAEAGAYGITIEGMKFAKKKKGLVKVGGDFCYPKEILEHNYKQIKDRCHRKGIKFYCAENRLRYLGDSLTCCGVDGIEGFNVNKFNINRFINGGAVEPTENMKKIGTAKCFNAINQTSGEGVRLSKTSFYKEMIKRYKEKEKTYIKEFAR